LCDQSGIFILRMFLIGSNCKDIRAATFAAAVRVMEGM